MEDVPDQVEGCYLYFNPFTSIFDRSGMWCNRPAKDRQSEHRVKARAPASEQRGLYAKHPSRDAPSTNPLLFDGTYFEDMKCYLGVGWRRCKRTELVSLFHWSPVVESRIKRSSMWKSQTDEYPDGVYIRTRWVTYLFELVYDLCLKWGECASEGPGFEGPIGWYI